MGWPVRGGVATWGPGMVALIITVVLWRVEHHQRKAPFQKGWPLHLQFVMTASILLRGAFDQLRAPRTVHTCAMPSTSSLRPQMCQGEQTRKCAKKYANAVLRRPPLPASAVRTHDEGAHPRVHLFALVGDTVQAHTKRHNPPLASPPNAASEGTDQQHPAGRSEYWTRWCRRRALRVWDSNTVLRRVSGSVRRNAWIWVPVIGYWILPMLEQLLLFLVTTYSPNQEAILDAVASDVYIPIVGIIWAILVQTLLDNLLERYRHLVDQILKEINAFAELAWYAHRALPPCLFAPLIAYGAHLQDLISDQAPKESKEPSSAASSGATEPGRPLRSSQQPAAMWELRAQLVEQARGCPGQAEVYYHAEFLTGRVLQCNAQRRLAEKTSSPPLLKNTVYLLGLSLIAVFVVVSSEPHQGSMCSSVRMRVMFAVICGCCSALHKIVADLNDIWSGSYSVGNSPARAVGLGMLGPPIAALEGKAA